MLRISAPKDVWPLLWAALCNDPSCREFLPHQTILPMIARYVSPRWLQPYDAKDPKQNAADLFTEFRLPRKSRIMEFLPYGAAGRSLLTYSEPDCLSGYAVSLPDGKVVHSFRVDEPPENPYFTPIENDPTTHDRLLVSDGGSTPAAIHPVSGTTYHHSYSPNGIVCYNRHRRDDDTTFLVDLKSPSETNQQFPHVTVWPMENTLVILYWFPAQSMVVAVYAADDRGMPTSKRPNYVRPVNITGNDLTASAVFHGHLYLMDYDGFDVLDLSSDTSSIMRMPNVLTHSCEESNLAWMVAVSTCGITFLRQSDSVYIVRTRLFY